MSHLCGTKLDNHISPIHLDDDKILGLQVHLSQATFYIFQVYLPSSNNNIELYRQYIEKLNEIVYVYSSKGIVLFQGDFNAHLQGIHFIKENNIRSKCLLEFLNNNNFTAVNTLPICTGARSTFVSYKAPPKKCVFRATVSKMLGRVGFEFLFYSFFLSPKIPVKTAKNH